MAAETIPYTHPSALLWADESTFRENLDRAPFYLAHGLAGHPLFAVPRLLQLAQLLKFDPNYVAYDSGEVHVEDRWSKRPPRKYTLEEAIDRIDHSGTWVILKHTEFDPEFKALREDIMSDIQRVSGRDLRTITRNLELQIMLTSPGRITPYHIDNECNVLLQVKGEKDIFIFDPKDREILTDYELERFWVGDGNAGEYKPKWQEKARAFRLAPGKAVHIPVNAPHWVKNDANVSISVSVNFEWKDDLIPNVYRANFFLRKLGLKPRPPGQSGLTDAFKSKVVAASLVPARNIFRGSVRWARRLKRVAPHRGAKKPMEA
jgi:hypothetical protein